MAHLAFLSEVLVLCIGAVTGAVAVATALNQKNAPVPVPVKRARERACR